MAPILSNFDAPKFSRSGIEFPESIRPMTARHFNGFSRSFRKSNKKVMLDFSRSKNAFPNSMVPIVSEVQYHIAQGTQFELTMPHDESCRRLFINTNWAHFLEPDRYPLSDDVSFKHLALHNFQDSAQRQKIATAFMDVVMRTELLDRSTIHGIEWSINELTDNVINHANSLVGGFVQVTVLREKIAFCIVDSGCGILSSLRNSYPTLNSDETAIAEAVRAGVTSNKDFGQGNGLSGSLKIATVSNGSFSISSGCANLRWSGDTMNRFQFPQDKNQRGTVVDGQIGLKAKFNFSNVLAEATNIPTYQGTDGIELRYLTDDADALRMRMKDETVGFGSRHAGAQMNIKAKNLLNAEPGVPLTLDWEGIQLIVSSFADEFLGKLFVELGPVTFSARIRHVGMDPVVRGIIDRAVLQRVIQSATDR